MTDPTPPAGDKSISGVGRPTRYGREMAEAARAAAQQRQDPRSNVFDMEAQARAPGTPVLTFAYLNHRGRIGERKVRPIETWYGVSPYYEGPAYYLRAYDLDRQAERDFRFDRINPPPKPGYQTILKAIQARLDNAVAQEDRETAARLTLLDHLARLTLLPSTTLRYRPTWTEAFMPAAGEARVALDRVIDSRKAVEMAEGMDGVVVTTGRDPADPPPPSIEIMPGVRKLNEAPAGQVAFEVTLTDDTDIVAVVRTIASTVRDMQGQDAPPAQLSERDHFAAAVYANDVLMPAAIPFLSPIVGLAEARRVITDASIAEYARQADDSGLDDEEAACAAVDRMWGAIYHLFAKDQPTMAIKTHIVEAMMQDFRADDAVEPPPVGQNDREDLPLETQHQLREAAETFLDEMAGEESFEAADFVADVARELEDSPALPDVNDFPRGFDDLPAFVIGELDADTLATLRNEVGHGGLFMPLDLSDLTVVTPGAGHTGPGLTFTAPATPVVTDAMVDAAVESWVKSAESVNLAINRNPSVVASIRQGLRDALEAAAAVS